jgi:hypothetical protein
MIYEREQHDGQVMSHYWIGTGGWANYPEIPDGWAMPLSEARAATPAGLSQSVLASCQHRIAIARSAQ